MNNNLDKREMSMALCASLVATLYVVAEFVKVANGTSDFVLHAKVAEAMLQGGTMPPHFLYQILLILLHGLSGLSIVQVSHLLVFIIVAVTIIVAWKNIENENPCLIKSHLILAVLLLFFSHPIFSLVVFDNHMYFGYIASNVYHNPSILLLKPLALFHFIFLCNLLGREKRDAIMKREVSILACLTILTIIAKPNYIIALLPAIFFLIFVRTIPKIDWRNIFLIIGLGVIGPAVIFLLWQYLYFYNGVSTNSIGIGFLEVFDVNSKRWTLPIKLVASIAFPVSVIAVMGSKLLRKLELQLSFLMLFFSLIYSYLLVDNVDGQGTAAGNFWWSAQISSFLVFFVCIKNYSGLIGSKKYEKDSVAKWIYFPAYIGVAHFIFGAVWYFSNVIPIYWSP